MNPISQKKKKKKEANFSYMIKYHIPIHSLKFFSKLKEHKKKEVEEEEEDKGDFNLKPHPKACTFSPYFWKRVSG